MRAHFGLPSVTSGEVDGKKPLSIQFEIPYFTLSGINVRYLKIVDKTGYTAVGLQTRRRLTTAAVGAVHYGEWAGLCVAYGKSRWAAAKDEG